MIRSANAIFAEFIGTFALIFVGAGAATALGSGHVTAVAFADGFAIMVFAFAFGGISGCHINPARTLGPDVARGMYDGVGVYPAAQIPGGVAAGLFYRLFCAAEPAATHLRADLTRAVAG